MKQTDTYIFDDDYEEIYKLSTDGGRYEFHCGFQEAGVTQYMSDDEKLQQMGRVK